MSRIFKIETVAGTGLIIALSAAVFITGCPKKQTEPSKTSAASEQKKPGHRTPPPSSSVESGDQNTANEENKTTSTVNPRTAENVSETIEGEKSAAVSQVKEPALAEPADFKPYDSLKDQGEKIDFIGQYTGEHPNAIPAVVNKVLDDEDADVRAASLLMLEMADFNDGNTVYVITKALKDTEPRVRQAAIEACNPLTDPAVVNILAGGLADESEEVRASSMEVASQKEPDIRLPVLKASITSQYEDVKEGAVSSLIEIDNPDAVDILITGLKDPNPDFRESVKSAINFLISQEFDTYDQAQNWWNANRNKFDDELNVK